MTPIKLLCGILWTCGLLHVVGAGDLPAKGAEKGGVSDSVLLVVAEALPDGHVADPEVLAGYLFVDGTFARREEILTAPNKQIRFDFDGNQIYLNRYAITRWGDVVDIPTHALLHKSNGENLVAYEDNSIILYRSNDRSFYRYDLRTQEHSRLDGPDKWSLLAKGIGLSDAQVLSPDGTRSVVEGVRKPSGMTGQFTAVGGTLTLCTLDGATRKLAEGFKSEVSIQSSSIGTLPVLWLDNERVLTQESNGNLVCLKMDGSKTPVVSIPVPNPPVTPARLSRDSEGRIIYGCGETYAIDIDRKQYAPLEWVKCGHGFETQPEQWPARELAIRYEGKEIGRGMFAGKTAATLEGYMAIAPRIENELPRVVHVWNTHTKTWLVLPLGGPLLQIFGWTEKLQR